MDAASRRVCDGDHFGAKNAFYLLEAFMHRNDPFTETGSGQAQEKLRATGNAFLAGDNIGGVCSEWHHSGSR
jgi:hypothetical protein